MVELMSDAASADTACSSVRSSAMWRSRLASRWRPRQAVEELASVDGDEIIGRTCGREAVRTQVRVEERRSVLAVSDARTRTRWASEGGRLRARPKRRASRLAQRTWERPRRRGARRAMAPTYLGPRARPQAPAPAPGGQLRFRPHRLERGLPPPAQGPPAPLTRSVSAPAVHPPRAANSASGTSTRSAHAASLCLAPGTCTYHRSIPSS